MCVCVRVCVERRIDRDRGGRGEEATERDGHRDGPGGGKERAGVKRKSHVGEAKKLL